MATKYLSIEALDNWPFVGPINLNGTREGAYLRWLHKNAFVVHNDRGRYDMFVRFDEGRVFTDLWYRSNDPAVAMEARPNLGQNNECAEPPTKEAYQLAVAEHCEKWQIIAPNFPTLLLSNYRHPVEIEVAFLDFMVGAGLVRLAYLIAIGWFKGDSRLRLFVNKSSTGGTYDHIHLLTCGNCEKAVEIEADAQMMKDILGEYSVVAPLIVRQA